MSADIPLLLFAKAPIPGKVKTRLQSHCSAEQAAEIACILMEESVRKATKHWPGPVYLSVWLDHDHPFFRKLLSEYKIKMARQCDGDLGAKMQQALHEFGYPAAVMGCDAPHVSAATLKAAYQHLCKGESVIGPSEDGGYYLLGLTQQADDLFIEKDWGQATVFEQTRNSALKSNLVLTELATINDVDEWADLLQVMPLIPELADYISRTFAQLP